jgi:hypothetical protein
MPTFTTSQFDSQTPSRANTSRNAQPNITSGTVEYAVIQYSLAGTEAAADIIKLCLWPAGVIPIPSLSKVTCGADPGTTLTMDVGTVADPDGFADGLVLSAGGQIEFGSSSPMPAWLAQTPLVADAGTGNAEVYATVVSANTLTAATVLTFTLAYKRNR